MITREQYGLWKHEPVTKWFLEFLRDKQAFLKSAALDQWLQSSEWPETVRGQIIELQEIAELPFDAIEAFYQETRNGTEPESHQE